MNFLFGMRGVTWHGVGLDMNMNVIMKLFFVYFAFRFFTLILIHFRSCSDITCKLLADYPSTEVLEVVDR